MYVAVCCNTCLRLCEALKIRVDSSMKNYFFKYLPGLYSFEHKKYGKLINSALNPTTMKFSKKAWEFYNTYVVHRVPY